MGIEHTTLVLLAPCSDQVCVASDHPPSSNNSSLSCSSGAKFASPVCCGFCPFSLQVPSYVCLERIALELQWYFHSIFKRIEEEKQLPCLRCSRCQAGLRSGPASTIDKLEQIMYLLPADQAYSNFKLEKCLPSSLSSVSTGTLRVLMFKCSIMQSQSPEDIIYVISALFHQCTVHPSAGFTMLWKSCSVHFVLHISSTQICRHNKCD